MAYERFWAKVNYDGPMSWLGTQCWEWLGALNNKGYGHLCVDYIDVLAHRLAYELIIGAIPDGLLLDHRCHNSKCINPEHLRPVTYQQNQENRAGLQKNNTSGVRGVFWCKRRNRWIARVKHKGRFHRAGSFTSLEEAEEAVVAKRLELHTHNDLDRRIPVVSESSGG